MADNVVADAGSGGATFAADDISSVHYPRVKLIHGADGVNDGDVSTTNPLPVGTYTEDVAAPAAIIGTAVMMERDDALATLTPIEGDWAGLRCSAEGALWVQDFNSDAILADTASMDTNLGTVAGAVSGSEMQVDVVASLPAGTNAIGKLAANSGVDIGDVDVLSVIPGTSATSLGKAEDAAHSSGDTGVMSLAVRNDTLAALAGTDGDYAPLQVNASGALFIQEGAALDVSGATVTVDGSGVTQPVSGTVTANLGATDNAVLDQLELNTSYGDSVGAGTEAAALRVTIATDCTGVVSVDDNAGSLTVDNAGTFATQVDGDALTALQLIDDPVFADDAAFTLASSKVMMAGAIRDDSLTTLTAVEGDAVPLRVSSTGALHVTGAGGGTQYNVDDAAGGTDTGSALLVVRDDSLTTLTPADGDYTTLRVSSTGALHVTGGGGGTEYTEDVATANPIVGTATMMERDDALATLTPIEGDWAAMRCSATGALWVAVDGTVTVGSHAVTNAGTFATQVDGDALTALQLLDDVVVVEDAAAAANPTGNVMMSVRQDEVGSTAIASADNDVQALRSNQFGELKVTQIPDSTSEFKYAVIDAASSGDNTIQAAAGAGIKIRVLSVFLVAAGTVNARFESGAGGTALTGQMNLVVNTGFVLPFNPAGWFETADNALLNLELSAAISVDGCVTYVEI